MEKTLLERKYEIFEKQVKRLEVSLCQDMQTGAYIKGQYVSDFVRFQNMETENSYPGEELKVSELDYIVKRKNELDDLILTIKEDLKNQKSTNELEELKHNHYLERLERIKVMLGKSILYFPPMGSTLLHIWSLLQDDVKTAEEKFETMREEVEDLLVESGTITRDKLEEAKNN